MRRLLLVAGLTRPGNGCNPRALDGCHDSPLPLPPLCRHSLPYKVNRNPLQQRLLFCVWVKMFSRSFGLPYLLWLFLSPAKDCHFITVIFASSPTDLMVSNKIRFCRLFANGDEHRRNWLNSRALKGGLDTRAFQVPLVLVVLTCPLNLIHT